jgi:hypothetical protein
VIPPVGPKEVQTEAELVDSALLKRPELRAIKIIQTQLETELKLAKKSDRS